MSVSSTTGKRQEDSVSVERNESPLDETLESAIMKQEKEIENSEMETSRFKKLFCCCVPGLVSEKLVRTCIAMCMPHQSKRFVMLLYDLFPLL